MNQPNWYLTYERFNLNHNITLPHQQTSLLDIFETTLQQHRQQIASISMGKTLTYQELDDNSKKVASYLQKIGLQQGDKVAVMLPNVLQYPIIALGILRAGMVLVNINPLYISRELSYQLADSKAKALFLLENFANNYQSIPEKNIQHLIVCQLGDMLGGVKGSWVNFSAQYLQKIVPKWQLANVTWFSDVLKQQSVNDYQRPLLTMNDIALLQYTGGTTGIAKGAMLTHGNIIANVMQIDALINSAFAEDAVKRQNIVLTALPLYHVFAFTICCMYVFYAGYSQLLIANPRDIHAMIKDIQQYPLAFFIGVNTLFNSLIQHPKFKELDFSQLKATIGGGMSVTSQVARQWHDITGTPIVEGYGLSECSPVVAFNPLTIAKFTNKIGIPAPLTDIMLLDDDEQPVKTGERGEIAVKGPQVMLGYQNAPDETRAMFSKKGYFKTGDIGIMDEQGFIKIVDRKKDMIVVSGFNVYPNEIEAVMLQHPDVDDCGVIGIPDEKSGEVPKIFVVANNPETKAETLLAFAKNQLTGYKRPRHLEFVESLPKSADGKILRKELRKREGLV